METNNKINLENGDIQLAGTASYGEDRYFSFAPDDPVPGKLPGHRTLGYAQLLTDGTFNFSKKVNKRSQATRIITLPHCSACETIDGSIILYMEIGLNNTNIDKIILRESKLAAKAVRDYLAKKG